VRLRAVAGAELVGHDAWVSTSVHDPLNQQVFRPRFAPILAYVWYVVAVLLAIDLVRRGDARSITIGLGVILLISVGLYAGAQRPSVIVDDLGITLRNLVRDVYVPWHEVQHVGAVWALSIETAKGEFRSWAVTAANPHRRNLARRRNIFGFGAPPPESFEADDVSELPGAVSSTIAVRQAKAARHGPMGELTIRFVWEVVIGLVVALVLVAVGLAR